MFFWKTNDRDCQLSLDHRNQIKGKTSDSITRLLYALNILKCAAHPRIARHKSVHSERHHVQHNQIGCWGVPYIPPTVRHPYYVHVPVYLGRRAPTFPAKSADNVMWISRKSGCKYPTSSLEWTHTRYGVIRGSKHACGGSNFYGRGSKNEASAAYKPQRTITRLKMKFMAKFNFDACDLGICVADNTSMKPSLFTISEIQFGHPRVPRLKRENRGFLDNDGWDLLVNTS